jgi:pSer/pThr/pTyr-binding forkhead associated (FHA) protein
LFEGQALPERKSLAGWLAVFEGCLKGEAFSLYQGKNILGSSPHCSLRIPEEGVEEEHLSIRFAEGKGFVTDLDSETGILLNGKRTYRNELQDGDKIKVGKALLRIKML